MRDLVEFRQAVRGYRRTAGRTQQQLARAIGLHPDVLSHKLNGSDHAVLTTADVTGIVRVLAEWAALSARTEAEQLLALMEVPSHAISASDWAAPPLAHLVDEQAADGYAVADVDQQPTRVEQPLALVAPPVPPTPLIGRGPERQACREALSGSRLVTLTGVGGTGKTRLAVQLALEQADRFPGGVAFADLAAVPEPGLLAIAVARSLGLRPSSAGTAETNLVQALQGEPMLLVLDSLEHLLDATPLLARVLSAAPELRILATSRIPLRLYGEAVVRVPPLGWEHPEGPAASEAVQLFVQRARAAGARFSLEGEDLAAVTAICATLDGLPLAIEMAAARTGLYSPPALLSVLDDRLSLLTGRARDLPRRQRTLRATLDWSHELLDQQGRELFACLGVFAGWFDARAAAAVYAEGGVGVTEMLGRLDGLCDHSLLEVAPGATPSFRMLEPVREYALARLAETGRHEEVCRRHLHYYLTLADEESTTTPECAERTWLDQLESAYPNIRAAFEFARRQADPDCLDAGLRLAIALVPLWQQRLSMAEGALQFDRLLGAGADSDEEPSRVVTRTHALIQLAVLECFRGDYPRAVGLAEDGLALGLGTGDHHAAVRAHRVLGEAALAVGDDDTAQAHFSQQLIEAEHTGAAHEEASAYNMLGQVARHRHRFAESVTLLHQALRLFAQRPERDEVAIGAVLNSLGEVARDAGDSPRATRLFTAALHRHRQFGTARGMAYDLEGLSATAALRSDARLALHYLGAAQVLRERTGGPLPPVEQDILHRLLAPALEGLSPDEQQRALDEGRRRPLSQTLDQALAAT